ncbi:MAG: hypothetical protein ACRBN8_37840 [Nannocystales bacterium]
MRATSLGCAAFLYGCASRPVTEPARTASPHVLPTTVQTSEERSFDEFLEQVEHLPAPPPSPPYTGAEALAVDARGIPAFARLDFDPSRLPLRARVAAPTHVYTPHGLDVFARPHRPSPLSRTYAVLNPDTDVPARRPRLLCEHEGPYRVGMAFDEAGLETVVASPALLRPSPSAQDDAEMTPGVTLVPGLSIRVLSSEGGMARVEVQGDSYVAEGQVAQDRLDITFEYANGPTIEQEVNATLLRSIDFRTSPGGTVFASSSPEPRNVARAVGPVRDGYVFVRHEVDASVTVAGWVDAKAVAPGLPVVVAGVRSPGVCGGVAGGRPLPEPRRVLLDRGTLLRSVRSHEVVGVVTSKHNAECVRRCNSATPRVTLTACGVELTLEALSPHGAAGGVPPSR